MKYFLLSSLLLLFVPALSAQAPGVTTSDTAAHWLTASDWEETTSGARKGYLIRFTREGNFEEDAGTDHNRPYRYLMGRWQLDSSATKLTLAVDGLLGKTGVHPRYKRGRDYYLDYAYLLTQDDTLIFTDLLTGDERYFRPVNRKDYTEPAMRRLPKPRKDGVFKLPGTWGGGIIK